MLDLCPLLKTPLGTDPAFKYHGAGLRRLLGYVLENIGMFSCNCVIISGSVSSKQPIELQGKRLRVVDIKICI